MKGKPGPVVWAGLQPKYRLLKEGTVGIHHAK